MKVFGWIASCLFATSVVAYEAPETLGITKTYVPPGCALKASAGDRVKVHYTGTLHETGVKFDSSHDRGDPLAFTLGAGQVIRGWDEGIVDMCVNEKRKLIIPHKLAYGDKGFGSIIPPQSALVFDVELISFEHRDEL